ncbi:MAG: TerD family protein [Hormoscilla sp.]
MAINLQKGQTIVLDKNEYDLSSLTMGLGWDVAPSGGFFGSGKDFDLDSYALLLAEDCKLKNSKEDAIYYGHLKTGDRTVVHSGDNLTGEGAGDDEQIVLKLREIPEKYQKIVLGVNIYQAKDRKQHFGMVTNAFVRAIDAKGREIGKYSLSGDGEYDGKTAMLMGEVYRHKGEWKFRALGDAMEATLQEVVNSFKG